MLMAPKDLKKLRDVFVKLSAVFDKEIYIFPTGYVLNTPLNRLEINNVVVQLHPKHLEIITMAYYNNKEKGILYVKNLKEIKDAPFENIEYITDSNKVKEEYDDLDLITNSFMGMEFKPFNFSPDEEEDDMLFEELLSKNVSIEFHPDKSNPSNYITVGKTLFPLMTIKNYKDNIHYCIKEVNEELGSIIFDFNFSHFRMFTTYAYVKMV